MSTKENTLRERVADSIRESIILGDVSPGSRLQEIELAEQYETSRTPVREALRQLESEGFLVIKPRRGAIVAPITSRQIDEFYEIKSILESHAARQATSVLDEQEIDLMEELNSRLRACVEAGQISEMLAIHNEFHEVFVKAAGNEQLWLLTRGLVNRFQRYRIALSHLDEIKASLDQHEQIIAAFRARDAELAAKLVADNSISGSVVLKAKLRLAS